MSGAVLGAAALMATGQAGAKGCPSNSNTGDPAVQQYVEQVPTSCGSTPTGTGGTHHTSLPATVQKKIATQGGSPATQQLLTKIATSQSFGAPQKTLPASKKHLPKLRGPKTSAGRSALSASVSVVTDGSDGRLIGLVALMACVALVALGASVYRRRAR